MLHILIESSPSILQSRTIQFIINYRMKILERDTKSGKGDDCKSRNLGGFSSCTIPSSMTLLMVLTAMVISETNGFVVPSGYHAKPSTLCQYSGCSTTVPNTRRVRLFAANDNDDEEDDDFTPENSMMENFKSSSKKGENIFNDGKLGINIAIDPMTKEEAEELRNQAKELIEEKFEKTLRDMEKMREKAKDELAKAKESREFASQLEAQVQSQNLMDKIDKLTGSFMDATQNARMSTKLAAAADKATAASGQGVEIGSWGVLGDRNVLTDSGFLGSVDSTKFGSVSDQGASTSTSPLEASTQVTTNRVLVVADVQGDPVAKALLPSLKESLETKTKIPNLEIQVLSPSATMPLGANNAACVLLFCTSISQASSLQSIMDRLLRKTFDGGQLGKPPTQLVAISTHGTTRYDKFPFNMQNMMGGGKLEKRLQMEEALVQLVRSRENPPPLDYTIIKLGEKNFVPNSSGANLQLLPGDVLEEMTSVETATAAIVEAMAFQPFARNATVCVEGCVPSHKLGDASFWDESFLPLEGPEVWRNTKASSSKKDSMDLTDLGPASRFDSLVEYVDEWAELLAQTGKGLTTPILAVRGIESRSTKLMKSQDGVRLLFLPTNTGKNYLSREEELKKEKEGSKGGANSALTKANMDEKLRQTLRKKEGGIDVVVEVTKADQIRVRARRCNYAQDAVLKELSEETILKRLQDALKVWKTEHL